MGQYIIIPILSLILSCVAIYVSVRSTRKGRVQAVLLADRQHKLSVFSEYTKRYQEIMLQMPHDFETNKLDTQRFMQLYFDLCNEMYYLYSHKLLSDDLWNMWEKRMQITTNVQGFKTYWKMLSYPYEIDFVNFFDKQILNKVPIE